MKDHVALLRRLLNMLRAQIEQGMEVGKGRLRLYGREGSIKKEGKEEEMMEGLMKRNFF